MRRSRLRSPASRCTTGIHSFAPTMAHAAVELTSPTTTIQSGPLRDAHLLVGDHHAAGLLGVAAAADFEMKMRLRQAQVAEERVRHVGVVVLAGVHDARRAPGSRCERVVERRDLHEVRARRGDEMDLQTSGSASVGRSQALI